MGKKRDETEFYKYFNFQFILYYASPFQLWYIYFLVTFNIIFDIKFYWHKSFIQEIRTIDNEVN